MFIGHLGKERCFIVIPRGQEDLRLPTDLLGLTPLLLEPNRTDRNLTAALGPACNQIRSDQCCKNTLSPRREGEGGRAEEALGLSPESLVYAYGKPLPHNKSGVACRAQIVVQFRRCRSFVIR
jgi:hypothetical protein